MTNICPHCEMDINIRNPSGYCDHLHYPEYCSICYNIRQKERGENTNEIQEAEQRGYERGLKERLKIEQGICVGNIKAEGIKEGYEKAMKEIENLKMIMIIKRMKGILAEHNENIAKNSETLSDCDYHYKALIEIEETLKEGERND